MSRTMDRAPTRRPMPVSQTDVAQRAGVNRSTISRLFAGPLNAALLPGKRCDVTHPVVVAWAKQRGLDPTALLGAFHSEMLRPAPPAQASIEIEQHSGYCGGCGELHSPYAGTPIEEFAQRAETPVRAVRDALTVELAPALRNDGRIDIAHPASLAFLARNPVDQDDEKAPLPVNGHDFLCPACPDDVHVDLKHPIFFAFLARWLGRVPQPTDVAEFSVEFHDWILPSA